MALGEFQVTSRLLERRLPVDGFNLFSAKRRDFCPNASAIGSIEAQQLRRQLIAEKLEAAVGNLTPYFVGPDEVALGFQEAQLIGDVEPAEFRAELDTVDDHRLGQQVNVVRTQVAMPIDDSAAGD